MSGIRQYTIFSSPDINVPSTIHVHLAIMSQPSTERNSTMPLPAFFVARWLLAEQPETLMQWFAVIGLFRGTCGERLETSLGFMLGQATQRHRHLSTICSMSQHNTVGEQHTTLRTVLLVRKTCPSGLVCVERTESKGISRGPSLSSLVDGQRRGQ